MKEKISLRKFKLDDIDSIMKLFVDKDVIHGIALDKKPKEITKKFEMSWLNKTINNYKKKKPDNYNLAILLDGTYIGNIGCHDIDYENKSLDIGYWIGKKYWGKGYMTTALKIFLKEIRRKFNPVRITACHFTYNPASGKVMQKCGFKHEGTRRKAHKKFGKFLDDEMYALVK